MNYVDVTRSAIATVDEVHVFLVDPSHGVGVFCTAVILHSDTAKQRFRVGRSGGPVGRHNWFFSATGCNCSS